MKPVDLAPEDGWRKLELGKGQPQYETLPALMDGDGQVVTVWELTAEELAQLSTGGRLMLTVLTFGNPFQPVRLSVLGGERDLRIGGEEEGDELVTG